MEVPRHGASTSSPKRPESLACKRRSTFVLKSNFFNSFGEDQKVLFRCPADLFSYRAEQMEQVSFSYDSRTRENQVSMMIKVEAKLGVCIRWTTFDKQQKQQSYQLNIFSPIRLICETNIMPGLLYAKRHTGIQSSSSFFYSCFIARRGSWISTVKQPYLNAHFDSFYERNRGVEELHTSSSPWFTVLTPQVLNNQERSLPGIWTTVMGLLFMGSNRKIAGFITLSHETQWNFL